MAVLAGIGVAWLSAAGASSSSAAMRPVHVAVAAAYDPFQPVTIAFPAPGGLPRGGYYYAAAVRGPTSERSGCAVSNDMSRTPYGYPRPRRWVTLTLDPAASSAGEWCQTAYSGAVYAVPHPPRCGTGKPCANRSGYECAAVQSPCPTGVLAPGPGSSLPKPIDRTTRIVARFTMRFPAGPPSVPATALAPLLADAEGEAARNGEPHPTQIEAVETTIGAAESLKGGTSGGMLGAEQVYFIAMRGDFQCDTCSHPAPLPGQPETRGPTGSVMTLDEPVTSGAFGRGFDDSYPNLGLLGVPVQLG